jgi:RNase P/RNase MRP subunit p29
LYNGLLIGKRIEVISALDKNLVKRNGIVVDETKNILVLRELNGHLLKLPKSIMTLNIWNDKGDSHFMIDGSKLMGTPDERIKG